MLLLSGNDDIFLLNRYKNRQLSADFFDYCPIIGRVFHELITGSEASHAARSRIEIPSISYFS